jgi:BNR/Asp-box repeat
VKPLFVATGDAVMRVADGRAERALEEAGAQCVAVDACNPERVLAGCREGGAFESGDGGATWRNAGLPATESSRSRTALPTAPPMRAASRARSGLAVTATGRSFPRCASFRRLRPGVFRHARGPSHVRWIAPSPHDADVVLAGIELGGLMRTSDGGATWEDHRPGAQRDVHSLAWHRTEHGRAYEAAGGCSAWSRDNGETWEPADAGRRWRGSGPWEELDLGLERPLDTMPYALASTDDSLVMALRDGRLFGSDDQGDSWRPLETGGLTKVVAMAA